MTADDWPDVEAIYVEGIATRAATFETAPPTYAAFDASHLAEHRLVAVMDEVVVGWIALAPTSSRACYRGVVEDSVYVAERARGRGVGRALMAALLESASAAGIWTIHAGVFPENAASVACTRASAFASSAASSGSLSSTASGATPSCSS